MWELLNRRVSLAIAVTVFACLFYGLWFYLMAARIDRMICHFVSTSPGKPANSGPATPPPFFLEFCVVSCILPFSFCMHAVKVAYRRWQRAKHDCCEECGHPISVWRGRCPGCGTRIGPDATRIHVI